MELLYQRIRFFREKAGLTQEELAKKMGYKSRSSINKIEMGENDIPQSKIVHFAKALGVTTTELMGWADSSDKHEKRKGVLIPVLGTVPAGVPIEAIEEILGYEEVTPEMARIGELFALKVKGDSMEPLINEGDVIIIKKQPAAETGDIVIAFVNGDNEATVKKFVRHEDGISLVPYNPIYSPKFYTAREVETLPIQVIGKVIELRRTF